MWRPKHVLGLTLGLTLFSGLAGAGDADLSGKWVLTMEGESPSGQDTLAMTFTLDGYKMVATMKGEESDIECQGWIDGNNIRFYYIRPTAEGDFVPRHGLEAAELSGGLSPVRAPAGI